MPVPIPNGPQLDTDDVKQCASVTWEILGPLRASSAGRRVELGPLRRRMLLAELLASAGERISRDALVTALWGEDHPDLAVNIVHKHVGGLRRLTEPALPRRAQGSWLSSNAGAYETRLDCSSLDLLRFRHFVTRADNADTLDQVFDLLNTSLHIWRGPVVGDMRTAFLDETPFSSIEREYVAVCMRAADLAIALGRSEEVISRLELGARLSPTDEQLRAFLIRSLTAAGRRDAAIRVFCSMRMLLRQELALDPGVELVEAYEEATRNPPIASHPSSTSAHRASVDARRPGQGKPAGRAVLRHSI